MFVWKDEIGLLGNIKALVNHYNITYAKTENNKASYDVDHLSMEQSHTDSYLNLVEAEQKITDLELRIIALEEANK